MFIIGFALLNATALIDVGWHFDSTAIVFENRFLRVTFQLAKDRLTDVTRVAAHLVRRVSSLRERGLIISARRGNRPQFWETGALWWLHLYILLFPLDRPSR